MLPILKESIELPASQHGFRENHSTSTAVCQILEDAKDGFNKRRPADRTVVVALDLKRAFDTVNHEKLHNLVLKSKLPDLAKASIYGYLSGRSQYTTFSETISGSTHLHSGVPQGGVLSPILFCWYISDMPTTKDVKITC